MFYLTKTCSVSPQDLRSTQVGFGLVFAGAQLATNVGVSTHLVLKKIKYRGDFEKRY